MVECCLSPERYGLHFSYIELKIITSLLLFLVTAVALVSCGDDEDKNMPSIIGSWTSSSHYYGGTDTFTFKKNGTYNWSYSGSMTFEDQTGSYIFNGTTLTVTNKKGTTWLYLVIALSDSSMVIMDEDGDKFTYYKK